MSRFEQDFRATSAHAQADDEDEDEDSFEATDRIRRSYHAPQAAHGSAEAGAPEPIRVRLNEGFLGSERRLFVESLANARTKLASLRMFNPAQNESLKQRQQDEWNEKEKYTLDSLNEFRSHLGERFQWNQPQDGREVWPSKLQYFLAITSYSIGLGNVIRFPILVQKNGGLAFIIPFVIMLLLEGIPLFYLELAIGQRMRKAAISCWHSVSPLAAGIGLASAAVSFLIGLYYNTMVAWTLLYTWGALTSRSSGSLASQSDSACPQTMAEVSLDNAGDEQSGAIDASALATSADNSTQLAECQLASPFEFHWYRETLNVTRDINDWSHFNWPIALCLLIAWLISYLCLVRGLSSSKRLVYVISIFPYVILLVFFFKATSLRGMDHGLRYLFEPDWPKLFDPFVWFQAAAQVFFSLGLGFGGLIALSSYNAINNNCYRDAIKVSLINLLTSILAGVVIFSILGFKATLNHDKCQLAREQQIDFYLADYNLKVLDYGAVFKQVPLEVDSLNKLRVRRHAPPSGNEDEPEAEVEAPTTTTSKPKIGKRRPSSTKKTTTTTASTTTATERPPEETTTETGEAESGTSTSKSTSKKMEGKRRRKKKRKKLEEGEVPLKKPPVEFVAETASSSKMPPRTDEVAQTETSTESSNGTTPTVQASYPISSPNLNSVDNEEEFSAEDAIASINNLDRQLDLGSPSGSFDYGDSDTEFVLNASNLISRSELERIISNINELEKCSVERELEASTRGLGLVFVAMAEAIDQFEPSGYLSPSSWTLLFFLMILTLGLDSQFGNLEGLLSSLTDLNYFNLKPNMAHHQEAATANGHHNAPNGHLVANNHDHELQMPDDLTPGNQLQGAQASSTSKTQAPATIGMVRQWAAGTICLLSFCLSLAMFAHGAGSYVFAIFDEYAGNFSLVLIALFELLTIAHVYGLKRFCDECELMTGQRPPFLVLLSWRYISPLLLSIVVATTVRQFTLELNYDVWQPAAAVIESNSTTTRNVETLDEHLVELPWPTWSIIFGLILIVACVIWIPLVAILRAFRIDLIPVDEQGELRSRRAFPAEELKEFHQLQDQEHQVTRLERILFGFRQEDDD